MSLASAVVLLQTALSLLTLVNANPSLPQSMRDNATAVAQHAISEAHAVLGSTATSADVADDDIASPADEAIAQAALAKAPSIQTVAFAPASTKAGPAYVYPNPTLTPGAVLTTDASAICTAGYAASVRNVSAATKKQVYAEYGVSYPQAAGAYEVDHFVPLEIGGSNDIKNLWLEPASPTPGFHQKDQFENFEHDQACKGTINAAEAQSRMVSDWYLYWEEEVEGTTPTQTSTPVQSASAPVQAAPAPAPQVTTTTAAASAGAYYTSSYHTAKYWYPASCSGWQSLSKAYLEAFPRLDALLAKYPGRSESPGC